VDAQPPFSCEWRVPQNLPYFEGHFPGNPIFPAVGIVDASTILLKALLRRPEDRLIAIPSAKFMHPIVPNDEVVIEVSETDSDTWKILWRTDDKDKADLALLSLKISAVES
jgi:3-hydroxymyristoyl/3-hydroxydecanoyl-(acyl carrier protein) dehydratase